MASSGQGPAVTLVVHPNKALCLKRQGLIKAMLFTRPSPAHSLTDILT